MPLDLYCSAAQELHARIATMTTSLVHHAPVADRVETAIADLFQGTTIVLTALLGLLTVAATF
jgi:hypothetical protein